MAARSAPLISAQVILKPARGTTRDAPITSQNLHEALPPPGAGERARAAFAAAGFDVGPVVGTSFSITAPAGTFEKVFGTRFRRDRQSRAVRPSPSGASEYELPVTKVPEDVKPLVETVTLTPPPDFGPTSY